MSHIDSIMNILAKEYKRFREPSVSEIARSNDPFKVLISCLISLRTKDDVTFAASDRLYKLADTPAGLLKVSVSKIEKVIYPCSFFRVKAGRIKEICKILLDDYNGKVPDEIDELLKFPGVGRKTANLTVTLGYRKQGICVDSHVHKISNRLGFVNTKNPNETEFALRTLLPEKYWIPYNDYLVAYGQNICRPVSPFCSKCKISKYCKKVGVKKHR